MAKKITVLEARDRLTKHADFSPDGRRVVAAISNGTARVWDVESGKLVAILKGHKAALWSASFSADSKRIVTTAEDGTARIWDAYSAKEIAVLEDPADKRVLSASFSPDGQRVITKHAGAIARLWDLQSGRQIAAMKAMVASRAWTASPTTARYRIPTATDRHILHAVLAAQRASRQRHSACLACRRAALFRDRQPKVCLYLRAT